MWLRYTTSNESKQMKIAGLDSSETPARGEPCHHVKVAVRQQGTSRDAKFHKWQSKRQVDSYTHKIEKYMISASSFNHINEVASITVNSMVQLS